MEAHGQCLPCGLSCLGSLEHHGLLLDPAREKGQKMRKAAALVRSYIADWFIKHLLKTLPVLLV